MSDATIHQGHWARHSRDAVPAKQRQRRRLIAAAILLALLLSVPLWTPGSFGLARYSTAIAYVIAAIGLNLALGYAGEMVLGHAAIMAASAYGAGMAGSLLGLPFWLAAPCGLASGLAVGMAMMLPGLRVTGWYLALITMFMVIVTPHLVILGEAWTGGEFGLSGIRGAEWFGGTMSDTAFYAMTVFGFALVWLYAANVVRSEWGLRFRALRDARQAAQAVGIDLARTRVAVYLTCAIPPALAGVLLAYTERFVNAESFGIGLTLLLLTGVVLGGAGTLWGPIVGMVPLVALSFWVGPFSPYNAILLGVGLLVCTLVFPDGLVPAFTRKRGDTGGDADVPAPPELASAPVVPVVQRTVRDGPVLECTGIAKRFGGLQALGGVDLTIGAGACVGLVGPNGSGKSTFLNALSGMIQPDSGTVQVLGVDVTNHPVARIASAGVGRTFQVPQLIEDLGALENIEIGLLQQESDPLWKCALRLPGVGPREQRRERAAFDMLVELGLPREALTVRASELPLGLKRIVEVGRAVIARPALLLLDEPAAGLNDDERQQLGRLLRRLSATGMTVLVVEHNVPFVMNFCDELVLLETGRVSCRAKLGDGPLPDALASYLRFSAMAEALP